VQIAKTSDLVFHAGQNLSTQCLRWAPSGLFACASEVHDDFTVGVSTDDGATFKGLYHLDQLTPLTCDPSTSTGKTCPMYWPGVQSTIGQDTGGDAGTTTSPQASSSSSGGCSLSIARSAGTRVALTSVLLAAAAAIVRARRGKRR
jgi:hypothetical protein